METAIDGAGRIVVPKALRDALRLTAGQRLDIIARDGVLEIAVPPVHADITWHSGWPVLVADIDEKLSADVVRETLEATRR